MSTANVRLEGKAFERADRPGHMDPAYGYGLANDSASHRQVVAAVDDNE